MPAPKLVIEPWPMDQPLPSLLTDADLMRVVQLRPAAFYLHKRQGAFKRLEANGIALSSTRYSGEKVEHYRRREPISEFGKKRHVKAGYPAHVQ